MLRFEMNVPEPMSAARTILILLVWLAGIPFAPGAAPERSQNKLRSLATLPEITVSLGMGIGSFDGPYLYESPQEQAAKILTLQRELKENPKDGEGYFRLGRYLKEAKREKEADEAYAQAVRLLRPRAEARPQDSRLQAQFADALSEAGQGEEAERVLQAGVRIAPEGWPCWVGLGEASGAKWLRVLSGSPGKSVGSVPEALQRWVEMLRRQPSPDQIEEARQYQKEADRCFDRAVALAPKEPEVYLARAKHRSFIGMWEQLLAQWRGRGAGSPDKFFAAVFSPEAAADLAQVARRSPTNYAAIGYWGMAEASSSFVKRGDGKPLESLPESSRKNVLEAMRLLENLTDHPNRRVASGAAEVLGMMRLIIDDMPGAMASFRRATALDPSREQAWDGLVGLTANNGKPEDLVALCEERIQHADTAANRLALAKACYLADLDDKALANARQAVRLEPENPVAQLCAGALLLRRPSADKPELEKFFLTARKLIDATEDQDKRQGLAVTYYLNVAIILGLQNEPDKARECLRQIAGSKGASEKAKQRAKEIEMALTP